MGLGEVDVVGINDDGKGPLWGLQPLAAWRHRLEDRPGAQGPISAKALLDCGMVGGLNRVGELLKLGHYQLVERLSLLGSEVSARGDIAGTPHDG